jgi:sporulation protein YlmC with PRC-barrel domain
MASNRITLSSTSLVGDKVVNPRGEDLGTIEDIMVDVTTGTVAYAVVSFGGFLGIGDKLFAMPWKSLRVDERNKNVVCDVAKKALEEAPGFDKDHWPDFSSDAYRTQIDSYYRPTL